MVTKINLKYLNNHNWLTDNKLLEKRNKNKKKNEII